MRPIATPIAAPIAALIAALILILTLSQPAHAHGDPHDRLQHLDAHIVASPADPDLHLRRGRLHFEEAHYPEARADFERVLALDPSRQGVRYFLAEALLQGGQPAGAEEQALRFLAAHGPAERGARSRGLWLLGQARMAQGQPAEALAAYREALAVTAEPTSDHYHLYVDAARQAGGPHLDEALAVIDLGLARGGSPDLLQGMAVELELQAGRPAAAVARLDSLAARGRRTPFLRYQQAEILAAAGRPDQAGAALAAAREALATVPPAQRRAKAYATLGGQIAALEAGLATPPGAAGRP